MEYYSMQADQSDSSAERAPSANNLDENIGNGRSESDAAAGTQGWASPIEMVLIDPFEKMADGQADAVEVGMLLLVLADALDNLGDTNGLNSWLKGRIDNARQVTMLAEKMLRAALDKIDAGENVLYEARVPSQFRSPA